jgi:hypothetical protein
MHDPAAGLLDPVGNDVGPVDDRRSAVDEQEFGARACAATDRLGHRRGLVRHAQLPDNGRARRAPAVRPECAPSWPASCRWSGAESSRPRRPFRSVGLDRRPARLAGTAVGGPATDQLRHGEGNDLDGGHHLARPHLANAGSVASVIASSIRLKRSTAAASTVSTPAGLGEQVGAAGRGGSTRTAGPGDRFGQPRRGRVLVEVARLERAAIDLRHAGAFSAATCRRSAACPSSASACRGAACGRAPRPRPAAGEPGRTLMTRRLPGAARR